METPFFSDLRHRIGEMGGLFNAHLHLDRAGTLAETQGLLADTLVGGLSHLSLAHKHSIISTIHESCCYDLGMLEPRVAQYLELLLAAGTSRADTVVDVTADRVGLQALECVQRLQSSYRGRLDLRLGAYNPLGFRDDQPQRWELLTQGAATADFIGALPERDDHRDYPEHIGFDESCRRLLRLGAELRKPIHIHVDQQNHPLEGASERVVRIARELGLTTPRPAEPQIWLVHVISPSTYDEPRFLRLLEDLFELNIGVICCPSAAISMRQIRPLRTPTFNSIARVLEILAAGVAVRVGSDNICDITSPAGTTDLVCELFVLSNALRYYELEILAKLGAGKPLTQDDIDLLHGHLSENEMQVERVVNRHS